MGGYYKYMTNGETLIRPVPSGGARNPYETYLAIHRITIKRLVGEYEKLLKSSG